MLPILLALLACNSSAPEGDAHDHADHADQAADALVLSLDGSAKWKMDAHTRKVMAKTRETIHGADTSNVQALQGLGAVLQRQLDKLIEGCTMDGPAHDELHVFLMAWIPKVDALKKATGAKTGQVTVDEMMAMLDKYDEFFE